MVEAVFDDPDYFEDCNGSEMREIIGKIGSFCRKYEDNLTKDEILMEEIDKKIQEKVPPLTNFSASFLGNNCAACSFISGQRPSAFCLTAFCTEDFISVEAEMDSLSNFLNIVTKSKKKEMS